jgi:hypothetical protein
MANDILAAIKATYDKLDDSFDDLYSKCATDAQRVQLRSLLNSARDTFFAAAAKALTDNNPLVDTLTKQLQDVNTQVHAQLTSLTNIVATLDLITEAVKLAAPLAKLAAGA